MKLKQTEKQIESQILQWLNAQPEIFAFKVNTTGIWDTQKKLFRRNKNPFVIKGVSDILGIIEQLNSDGIFFAIEVKSKKGKLTSDQTLFLMKIAEKGGLVMKASSLEEVIRRLKPFLKNPQISPSAFPTGKS